MATIEIKHRITGAVLFACEVEEAAPSGLRTRAALEMAVTDRAYLQDADLQGAYLQGADLRGADLRGAYLQGAYLQGADLRGADLQGAYLRGAYLQDADLQGAYLRGAYLQDADLRGADLQGADLQGAYLQGADLQGADLQGAYLQGADLRGADLRGANEKPLPRATPAQAIENLDKVREIILDNDSRLNMSHWHGDKDWINRTCAEEVVCGTTHCLAGWLQVCSTEQALKTVEAQLAGILSAPVAAKMFFRSNAETLEWLRNREYAK